MYLKRFTEDLEDIGRCPPEVKKNLIRSIELLERYRFFESIEAAAVNFVIGNNYDGITSEELLTSAAKYRAINALLTEVKILIESEREKQS